MANEIKPEQVPDEVWAAFSEAVYKYGYGPHAIAAALNAWPGMERYSFPENGFGDDYAPALDEIILPLTEKPDE